MRITKSGTPCVSNCAILLTLCAALSVSFSACKSGSAQPTAQEQPLSPEERELVQKEQDRLDAVEQQRSGNPSSHSCRKAKEVYAYSSNKVIDISACSTEQLKLEQDAELKQSRDQAMASTAKRLEDIRGKFENTAKPVSGASATQQ